MRHNTKTKIVLSYLAEAGESLVDALLPAQYPQARLARTVLGLDRDRYPTRAAEKHSLSSLLSYLKKQGLVARAGPRKKSVWLITKKGISLLKEAESKRPSIDYSLSPEDGIIRLVTFDIPEKERSKRTWIRNELLACGFTLLQKSVYFGKRPLPEELIKRINELQLNRHIHIIGAQKSGTLNKIS